MGRVIFLLLSVIVILFVMSRFYYRPNKISMTVYTSTSRMIIDDEFFTSTEDYLKQAYERYGADSISFIYINGKKLGKKFPF